MMELQSSYDGTTTPFHGCDTNITHLSSSLALCIENLWATSKDIVHLLRLNLCVLLEFADSHRRTTHIEMVVPVRCDERIGIET